MSWPVVAGVIAGLVVGINLGVLLMVAMQAGRRQDDAFTDAALLVRIQELESTLARQADAPKPSGPYRLVNEPPTVDDAGSNGKPHTRVSTG